MNKVESPYRIKVPGAIWSIIIVVAVAATHHYLEDPFLVDLVFVIVGLVAPMLVDNNADLKKALSAISILTKRPIVVDEPEAGMRSSSPKTSLIESSVEVPAEPNRIVAYLFG